MTATRRFVVIGIGAIGGVMAARLCQAGFEVAGVARGEHLAAVQRSGLTLMTPDGPAAVRFPVVASARDLQWRRGDVAILAVKSQDTHAVLADMAASAPPSVTVVCAQNGVANEVETLRHFAATLGVSVICPAAHMAPGIVQAHSVPCTGILDVGDYPNGAGILAEEVAAAFRAATFDALAVPSIMRWKYAKLLVNLGNAAEAICGPRGGRGELAVLARQEGTACLEAAGIDYASAEEDAARREGVLTNLPVEGGQSRGGGSSWQSLIRGAGSIETDYLNGEIVLLGRIFGIPTPANILLQRVAGQMARDHLAPGHFAEEALLRQLRSAPM